MWAHNSDHKRKCLERFQTVIFIHNIMKQTERHEANRVIGNIGIPLEYLNNHHYLVRNRQLYLKYSKSLSVLLLYTFGMPWASETLNRSIMSSQTVCSCLVSTANCTVLILLRHLFRWREIDEKTSWWHSDSFQGLSESYYWINPHKIDQIWKKVSSWFFFLHDCFSLIDAGMQKFYLHTLKTFWVSGPQNS